MKYRYNNHDNHTQYVIIRLFKQIKVKYEYKNIGFLLYKFYSINGQIHDGRYQRKSRYFSLTLYTTKTSAMVAEPT